MNYKVHYESVLLPDIEKKVMREKYENGISQERLQKQMKYMDAQDQIKGVIHKINKDKLMEQIESEKRKKSQEWNRKLSE